jgi:hypothetical protein
MREHEPLYLHDIVLPKEVEKPRRGFDLDREFGEGTKERITKALQDDLRSSLILGFSSPTAENAAYLRILTGERFGTIKEEEEDMEDMEEDMEDMIEALEEGAELSLREGANPYYAVEDAAFFRILTGERFGTKEEQERMIEALQEEMRSRFERGDDLNLARNAALLRILTGERFGDTEEQDRMINALKEGMRSSLERKTSVGDRNAAKDAADLRILRAHDITFIPGKGIEIIDEPPEEYQPQAKIPLPEVRKF